MDVYEYLLPLFKSGVSLSGLNLETKLFDKSSIDSCGIVILIVDLYTVSMVFFLV